MWQERTGWCTALSLAALTDTGSYHICSTWLPNPTRKLERQTVPLLCAQYLRIPLYGTREKTTSGSLCSHPCRQRYRVILLSAQNSSLPTWKPADTEVVRKWNLSKCSFLLLLFYKRKIWVSKIIILQCSGTLGTCRKRKNRKGEKKRDKEGKTRQNRTTAVSLLSNWCHKAGAYIILYTLWSCYDTHSTWSLKSQLSFIQGLLERTVSEICTNIL